jgi:hydroxymethylbilane synthase
VEIRAIKIGVRPSLLALKQAQEAIGLLEKIYPGATFEILKIDTPGDRDKATPLTFVDGSDFFTRDIDEALLAGRVDAAVHSSKDLPEVLPKGLEVLFETESISRFDALVSKGHNKFTELTSGSRIGASSLRRKKEVKGLRPDLEIVDARGTIVERLSLVDSGKIDALIVAHAALIRLKLEHRISEIFPLNIFKTHPKQGCLSIVARKSLPAGRQGGCSEDKNQR